MTEGKRSIDLYLRVLWADGFRIEFGEMRIKVDYQLQQTAQMQYVIEEPET